jgi:type I restriction enzyme M protein
MQAIFGGAATVIREATTLHKLVTAIEGAEWYSDSYDAFGDAYEGLLQKNAEETKRGAGQYFTPRALVDAIVDLTRPRPGEIIQDPAAGTGGFLVAADRALRRGWKPRNNQEARFQNTQALRGVENVIDTYRLLCMNLYLHGIEAEHVIMGDTLSPVGSDPALANANVILSNPPFGSAGGPPSRPELMITRRSTYFQLPFVEHCLRALAPGGRAAVIVPDNVLFEGGAGRALRQALMRECDLHTILRLPTGIFYAQGVRTNVLFFSRPNMTSEGDATEAVWIYDMRASDQRIGRPGADFARGLSDFIEAFGPDPLGRSKRTDGGEAGRFRRFSREAIAARDDDLYVTWLKEGGDLEAGLEHLPPDDVAAVLEQHLVLALGEIRALIDELDEDRLGAEIAE